MSRLHRRASWLAICLLSGTLFQTTATSCQDVAVAATASLTTNVVNQMIRNSVYTALGLGSATTSTGLGGFGGLGT
jgi:hypothetical protein